MFRSRFTPLILLCFCISATVRAAEVIPPAPTRYFNDYASVVPPADADRMNLQLDQFERDTSNQIVVAIYPKMQTDSEIADYTYRVKETWHVGQKGKNNGAVLFVFVQDHKLFIQVNYGLEGALPDATCKEIIDQDITPRFKTGDFAGGLDAGVNAILAAAKGEYKGNGATAHDNSSSANSPDDATVQVIYYLLWTIVIGVVLSGPLILMIRSFGGTFYQRHARSLSLAENLYMLMWNIGFSLLFSGGSRGGGGGGGSSRGGFTGGGGTGGGGGAGGSW